MNIKELPKEIQNSVAGATLAVCNVVSSMGLRSNRTGATEMAVEIFGRVSAYNTNLMVSIQYVKAKKKTGTLDYLILEIYDSMGGQYYGGCRVNVRIESKPVGMASSAFEVVNDITVRAYDMTSGGMKIWAGVEPYTNR